MAFNFLSINSVAQRLGVSRWTVARMLADGEIPHVPVRGTPRIDPIDLDNWIERQKAASIQRVAQGVEPEKRPVGRPRKEGIKPRKPSKDDAE
jgi:excisionase family DNA binding protein